MLSDPKSGEHPAINIEGVVGDVMHRSIVTVPPSETLADVVHTMRHESVRYVMVTDLDRILLGVLSDCDVVRVLGCEGGDPTEGVTRAMVSEPQVVRMDTPLGEAIALLQSLPSDCLPVVDPEFKVAGILTSRDVLDALASAPMPKTATASVAEPAPPAAAQVAPPTQKAARKRVLFADDLRESRLLFKRFLERTLPRAEVLEAANGAEAVQLASACQPDLILLDLRMPDMDGWEAARRIRAIPGLKDTPIIALSSNATAKAGNDADAAGCSEFIVKPVSDYSALRRRILYWMDQAAKKD